MKNHARHARLTHVGAAALIVGCLGTLGTGLIIAGAVTGQWAEVVPGVSTVIGALAAALKTSEGGAIAPDDSGPPVKPEATSEKS